MLCATCQNIFSWDKNIWPIKKKLFSFLSSMKDQNLHGRNGKFHDTRYSLEASARAGCHLCATVWGSLTEEKRALIGTGSGSAGALFWELSGKHPRDHFPNFRNMREDIYWGKDVCWMIFGFQRHGGRPGNHHIEGEGILLLTAKREKTAYYGKSCSAFVY
jgi:hypothetical protein